MDDLIEKVEIDDLEEAPKKKPKKEKKEKKKRKAWKIILLILLLLLLLLAGAVVGGFFYFYGKTNYVKDPDEITLDSEALGSIETMDPDEIAALQTMTGDLSGGLDDETENPESGNETAEKGESQGGSSSGGSSSGGGSYSSGTYYGHYWSKETTQTPTVEPWKGGSANVYNLMLVGVDRETNWNGNSDTMILISINTSRRTVTMTSFMRDSAAMIPGVGFTKLNHAFAVGNGPLLIKTIQQNYKIDVNHYAWVDFAAMEQIIKILGGVDLYLTVEEAKYCGITISEPQVLHLTPWQTVRHCRDRRSFGYDYQRTQRQRNVLMAIANKAKAGSLGDLISVANAVLPYITHNVDAGRVAWLIGNLPEIASYTFNEQRIPYNELYNGTANGNLVPLFPQTISRWHNFVYGY